MRLCRSGTTSPTADLSSYPSSDFIASRQQCTLHNVRFFLDQPQQFCRWPADPALPLFPLPVARQAHAHQWCHLCLCQSRLFPHLARCDGLMDNGRAFALRMGKGLGHRLDKIVAEGVHLYPALPCRCSSISRRRMALMRPW